MTSKTENKKSVSSKTGRTTNNSTNKKTTEKSVKNVKTVKNNVSIDKNHSIRKNNEWERLYAFMMKYRVKGEKGSNLPVTHTMCDAPYGKYNIPDDMRSKFLRLYENAIVAGFKPHITELHKEYGPIIIDLDFCQPKEHGKRYYTEITIRNVVKLYNSIIKKYLNVEHSSFVTYVSEKERPVLRNGEYHDGLHITYPYICTQPSLQFVMREEFIKLAKKYKIFQKIPLTNNLESVFDEGVIYKTGWLLYGSRKNENSYPYYVSHCFLSIRNELHDYIIPGDNLKSRENIRHFINTHSCRRFFSLNDLTPLAEGVDPLAIDAKLKKIKEKINNNTNNTNTHKNTAELGDHHFNFIKAVSEETLVEAKNLVKLFSVQRATDYHTWYQVGRCLSNIDHRLLEDWITFSKKCPSKFKKEECERLWRNMNMKPSNYTMATLHYFASKDDPDKYFEMKKLKIDGLIKEGMEASHHTIAKLLIEKYKFIYKCASIKNGIWYEFRNHRWIEIDSAYTLRNLISEVLVNEYANRQRILFGEATRQDAENKKEKFNDAVNITKVIKQLNNNTFKNGVIKECADIAYDPNFLRNLDENNYLIGFENGVFDLETGIFRDGCPDDCISLCTNYKYIEIDEDDETFKNINGFLKKIQPDKSMREYILTLLSTCLSGTISEESFYVLTGSGANGKSKLMELLKYTLGDLYKPMDIRLLTEKRSSSSSASPELADKKGIRACPFDEPKASDEINTGFMKIFTGGDTITARALYKEPIYFKPQFKPFLLCNELPTIKSDDDGTWRRLKVIPFLSKFIKHSEATKKMKKEGLPKNHFWADTSLSEKLPDWKQGFMCLLLKYFRKYRKHGLIHPKLVTQHTVEYRKKCDVFQDFIGDYLVRVDNTKKGISVMDLYQNMREWYKSNYTGKCPNAKDLRNYVQHRMPTYNKNADMLTCYVLKTEVNQAGELIDDIDNITVVG